MSELETLSAEKSAPAPAVAAGKICILLVDDEVRNLDVLESILASPELRLVRAQTPEDALLALVHDEFACIVMDIQMPGMTGLELSRLIKTRKRSQHIPIIFLTAYFLEEKDILQGYGAGAVDYLTKPLNAQILKSKVGVFVDLFRTTHALAAANSALEGEVAQRKNAEEALRRANSELEARVEQRTAELVFTEKRYREVVQGLPAAIYVCDVEGRITLYNQAAVDLWGREPHLGQDRWCGSHKIYSVDGKEMNLDTCPMARAIKENRAVRGEEIIIETPQGIRRHIQPFPQPLHDPHGRIIGAVNMLLDVTERKTWEEAMRRLAAIVKSSDDAIISKDLNSIVTSWNDSAQRIFGYTAEEMIGKPITLLIPEEFPDEEPRILERIRRGEPIRHYETVRRCKNGSLVDISLTVSPIKNADGKIIGASKVARDITERKRAGEELKRAHEELLAAARAKDHFLATLSHELRTPLNPILLLASEAANDETLSDETRADFELIHKNVELEARLIDDLLDLTRITRGKILLDKHHHDAHSILHDAIANVQDDIMQKRITLELKLDGQPAPVYADMVRLQQVFWNLLKNAVKFTPEKGRIIIETETKNQNQLVVRVTDTGIGIAPEELGAIFNAFSQGDHAQRFGGLGLGLAISKRLMEFHDGKIYATSEGRNRGATFTVELPLAKSTAKKNPANGDSTHLLKKFPETLAANVRILLVEDHEPTRTTLAQLLARRKFEVFTAASVAEALAHSQNFHLLISDIGLPDGNGYELMVEMRKRGCGRGIAMTGFGMEQDVARSQEAGFLTHLTKPVRIQSLESALKSALMASPEKSPAVPVH